ncbi:MAG: ROK family protein [Candidatus Omnitrophica bacterium]|nr:ROK family protein [Candidatus Omnitrophota bacterium]
MAAKYVIGIDLGGTNLKIAVLDFRVKIRRKLILSTRSFKKKEELIRALCLGIREIVRQSGLTKADIRAVGIGLPGPVDVEKGLVHFFPNIPGFKEVCLRGILRKRLGLGIFLDNDANLMCLAEHRFGAAKGSRNAFCITLGTGVGGGLIINGSLYRARSFAAGEIGHLPLNENGPRCNCGGIACLEAYIGNNRIRSQAKKVFGHSITLEELSLLAKRGNKKALRVWKVIGRHLGVALSSIVNVLSPDIIVIGGGVADAGRALFKETRRTVAARAMPVQSRHVKISPALLGQDAGLIGAGIIAWQGN